MTIKIIGQLGLLVKQDLIERQQIQQRIFLIVFVYLSSCLYVCHLHPWILEEDLFRDNPFPPSFDSSESEGKIQFDQNNLKWNQRRKYYLIFTILS